LDGAQITAALGPDDSMLSYQPVAASRFLGRSPGSITLKGALWTPARSTLSVVGGEVSVDGGALLAPDGLINVVSAKAAGEVALDPVTWKVDASAIPMQGQISVRNAASLDASGDGGGRIVIRGGRLVVEAASIKADTPGAEASLGIDIGLTELLEVVNAGQITTATSGSGKGGDITITAPSIVLNGNNLEPDPNTFGSQTRIATGTSSAM